MYTAHTFVGLPPKRLECIVAEYKRRHVFIGLDAIEHRYRTRNAPYEPQLGVGRDEIPQGCRQQLVRRCSFPLILEQRVKVHEMRRDLEHTKHHQQLGNVPHGIAHIDAYRFLGLQVVLN
jgi:hypothetical protein